MNTVQNGAEKTNGAAPSFSTISEFEEFSERLNQFCAAWSYSTDPSRMAQEIAVLQEAIRKYASKREFLMMRCHSLEGQELQKAIEKIGKIDLFLHLGRLSLLKYNACLKDREILWRSE